MKFSATSAAQGSCAQALPDAETLKLTPDEAKALARSIEREWRLYAESTDCDITRTANFYALTELAYCSALEGGDAFALLPFIKRPASGPLVLPSNIISKTSAP